MPELINTIDHYQVPLFLLGIWVALWIVIYFVPKKWQPTFFRDKKWLNAVIVAAIIFAPILLLLLLVVLGMLLQISQVLLNPQSIDTTGTTQSGELRWYALSFVGLLTALGGIIGTPLALIRVFTVERQTAAQETGLITDRINKAVESLGAQNYTREMVDHIQYEKQGTDWKRDKNGDPVPQLTADGQNIINRELLEYTEPNIEVRIGAIYALERIAAEDLSFHIQIMEILCAYIRHNAPVSLASDNPAKPTKPREDIQTALTVLGRRSESQIAVERDVETPDGKGHRLDLRETCLQAVDLSNLNFELAKFDGANLQRAKLGGANLQGAKLGGANLQGAKLWDANLQQAELWRANLQQADLWDANLQQAELWGANLQGAELWRAKIDRATALSPATLRGAGLRAVDFTHITKPDLLSQAFGDATVSLPDGLVAGQGDLAHWSPDKLDYEEFNIQWRAHQASIGYTA